MSHQWKNNDAQDAMAGAICRRCGVERRFRKRPYTHQGSPRTAGAFTYVEEYSTDGGQTWGDRKAYHGKVPECRGAK